MIGRVAIILWLGLAVAQSARAERTFRLHVHLDNDPTFLDRQAEVAAAAQSFVSELVALTTNIEKFRDVVAPDADPSGWELVVSGSDGFYGEVVKEGGWIEPVARLDPRREPLDYTPRFRVYLTSAGHGAKNTSDFWAAASKASSADLAIHVLLTGTGRTTDDSVVPQSAGITFALHPLGEDRVRLNGSAPSVTSTTRDLLPGLVVQQWLAVLEADWVKAGGWEPCSNLKIGTVQARVLLLGDFARAEYALRIRGVDGANHPEPAPKLDEWETLPGGGLAASTNLRSVAAVGSLGARIGSKCFARLTPGKPPTVSVSHKTDPLFPGEALAVSVAEPADAPRAAWGALEAVITPRGAEPAPDSPRCRAIDAALKPCEFKAPASGTYDVLLRPPAESDAFEAWRAPPGDQLVVGTLGDATLALTVTNVTCPDALEKLPDDGQAWITSAPPEQWCFDYTITMSGKGPSETTLPPGRLVEFVALSTLRVRTGNEVVFSERLKDARGTKILPLASVMNRPDIVVELVPTSARGSELMARLRDIVITYPSAPAASLGFSDFHHYAWAAIAALLATLVAVGAWGGLRARAVRVTIAIPDLGIQFEQSGRATMAGERIGGFPQLAGIAAVLVKRRWFGLELVVESRRDFRHDPTVYGQRCTSRFSRRAECPWGPFKLSVTLDGTK